jgi:hypothetical protein
MDGNPNDFQIKAGEDFACICFSGAEFSAGQLPDPFEAEPGLWVSRKPPSGLPEALPQNWLALHVPLVILQCVDLVITAKKVAFPEQPATPLVRRAENLFWGICVVAGIIQFRSCYAISAKASTPSIWTNLPRVYQIQGATLPLLSCEKLSEAAKFAQRVEQMIEEWESPPSKNSLTGLYLRPISGFAAFQIGAQQREPAYRLHQFVRTVEAFMPASVRGSDDFVKRGSSLLQRDSRNANGLKQMYDLRSATEHHRPFDQRALPGVSNPNDIAMQRARQAETLAREVLRRFVAGPKDLLAHFKDETSLENFWASSREVSQAWGAPMDINAGP